MSISEKHKNLIHYTTWDGFRGILESKSLWATHIRFLNDESEYLLAQSLMLEKFPEMVKKWLEQKCGTDQKFSDTVKMVGGLATAVKFQTKQIIEALYEVTSDEFYITSFCTEPNDPYVKLNGLLSQWRAYGNQCGIAVYFQTEALEGLLQREIKAHSYSASFLDSVIYEDDGARIGSNILPRLYRVFEFTKIINEVQSHKDIPMDKASEALADFIYFSTFFKHRGFKEEGEVRFVASRIRHDNDYLELHQKNGTHPAAEKTINFRTRNSRPVPYLKLFETFGEQLPISKVLIGPGKDKYQVAKAVQMFVNSKNIEIAMSEIPFV